MAIRGTAPSAKTIWRRAMTSAVRPKSFRTRSEFRAWLTRNHQKSRELMIRLFKVHARHRGIGYKDALDEALCFGWIDGVRRALDENSFVQRFTPRQPRSNWSAVNIKRATELEAGGRMHPAGLAAFRARDGRKAPYSFESKPETLDPAFVKRFKARPTAWKFFESQPPGYRRITTFWVMSAKKPETRASRFAVVLDCSARHRRIPLLER